MSKKKGTTTEAEFFPEFSLGLHTLLEDPKGKAELIEILNAVTMRNEEAGKDDFGFFIQDSAEGLEICSFCRQNFPRTGTVIMLLDSFDICPACVMAGPSVVAAGAKSCAEDRSWVKKRWGYTEEDELSRTDLLNMIKLYRQAAKKHAALHSFADIPGGRAAIAIAEAMALHPTKKNPARRARKAA